MWLAPAVALVGLFSATVSADVTEGCCGCLDCNGNGVDDRCDVACSNSGTYCEGSPPQAASAVCNSGFFPSCATSFDCNANGVPDECDIAGGTSCDADLDAVPDECEFQIPANVIFVEDDAPPGGDGSTWCTAFQSLQDALAASVAGDVIRIAQGTHLPVDCGSNCDAADRTATFNLKNGVTIQGGYAGLGATAPDARDITAYESILSGDLLGDDVGAPSAENSYHVTTAISVDSTTILDGVTIRKGHADGTGADKIGAGMFMLQSAPVIIDCTFANNLTSTIPDGDAMGGGMYSGFSAPTMDRCVFKDNISNRGGGLFIDGKLGTDSPTITDCSFIENEARPVMNGLPTTFGGGAYVHASAPKFTGCVFMKNVSEEGGGGLCNAGGSATRIVNCVFNSNLAYRGGGAGNRGASDVDYINCTFVNNCAQDAGSTFYNKDSAPTLTNCILLKSITQACKPSIEGLPSENISSSLASGSAGFVDALGADGVPGTTDDDLRLDTGSLAIDAGDNAAVLGVPCTLNADCVAAGFQTCTNDICDGSVIITDIAGNVRIVDGSGCGPRTDIGAFEVQIDCDNGVCDPGENHCICSTDCSSSPFENDFATCHDGVDNDCDCIIDCDDPDCGECPGCGVGPGMGGGE